MNDHTDRNIYKEGENFFTTILHGVCVCGVFDEFRSTETKILDCKSISCFFVLNSEVSFNE